VTRSNLQLAFGLLLILLGLFISSRTLVELLRTPPTHLLQDLLLGARLFKIGLVTLGVIVILLRRTSIWRPSLQQKEALSNSPNRTIAFLVLTILVVGLGLRLYGLNEGLWFDEIYTDVNYARMSFGEIVTTYDTQNQHLLYSILAHFSLRAFGETAWALRLPAALFGVASIWALYLLARRVASTREALLSMALVLLSYHHIWFSQNARGYTGLLFFVIMASWLLERGLHESRPYLWLFYGIVAALGALTHITMVFVVAGHFFIYVVVLYARRNQVWQGRWMPVVGFGLAGILTLQLYALVLPQFFGGTIEQGSAVTSWKNPLWTLSEFFRGIEISFGAVVPAVLALCIFCLGLWNFTFERPIIIGLLVIPALLVATASIFMGHHLWPRLFFFTLGFGVIVLVRGSMRLGYLVGRSLRLPPRTCIHLGTGLFGIIILCSAVTVPAVYAPKQDYLGALNFVEKNKGPDDVVFTVGNTTVAYNDFYNVDWVKVEKPENLIAVREASKVAWIVYTFPPYLENAYPEIMNIIQRDFRLVKKFYGTLNGGAIFVCRSQAL
jgi:mannosyltransferase